MTDEHRTGSLDLEEMTRFIPPGWKPGLKGYSFKKYSQRLKLWWDTKNITGCLPEQVDSVAAGLVLGRLKGSAYKKGIEYRINRDGTLHEGSEAIMLPEIPAYTDAHGQEHGVIGALSQASLHIVRYRQSFLFLV